MIFLGSFERRGIIRKIECKPLVSNQNRVLQRKEFQSERVERKDSRSRTV